jgi:PAS domain S-box-containing protein
MKKVLFVDDESGPTRRWRWRLFGSSLRAKLLTFSGALVVGTVLLGGIAVWSATSDELLLRERERLADAAHDAALGYAAIVSTLQQDALMVAGAPAVQGLIPATERGDTDRDVEGSRQFWAIRAAALLKSLLAAKPIFREARLFQGDIDYREILRVERDGDSIIVGPDNQLPARSNRPDLRAAFRPGSGNVIVSDIELNHQQGRVKMPPRPVIHIIVPLRDSTNLPFGAIVLTADLQIFLAGIHELGPSYAQVRVVNARGQPVIHPDPAMVFGGTWRIEAEYPGFGAAFGTGHQQRAQQLTRDERGQDQVLGVHDVMLGSSPDARPIRFLYSARYADVRNEALVGLPRVLKYSALAVAVALPLALIFSTTIVRPLRRITTFITSWKPGTPLTDLPTDRADEIGLLAREFSRLLATLDEREARRTIKEAEVHRLVAALDATQNSVVITDTKGAIQYVNPAFERFSGIKRADIIGKDTRQVLTSNVRPSERAAFVEALKGQLPWKGRILTTSRDGQCFHEDVSLSPVRDAHGTLTHWISVRHDVTEQHQLESQLQQARKLESIGQLAAGIAHEINTPTQYVGDNIRFVQEAFTELNALLGKLSALSGGAVSAETLAQALASADLEFLREEVPKALEQSADGCQRISGIVKAMKDFSHPGQDKTPVDLNRAIASTVTVASNEWKYVAEMQTDFDAQLPPVVCLPGEFNQVILNMLVNAAHAITDVVGDGGGKGTITVTTRQVDGFAEIRISDTGTGIPPEIREKIFDPFFTTKQVGKGTGQGLAIAHDVIVNKHGGTIAIESEPGKGSTFIIRLPLDATGSHAAIAA